MCQGALIVKQRRVGGSKNINMRLGVTMVEENKMQNLEFKAEVQQLLSILSHSLYKERDIFLRATHLKCFRCFAQAAV